MILKHAFCIALSPRLHVLLGKKYIVILKSYLAMLAYFVKEITLNTTLNYVCIFCLGNILKICTPLKIVYLYYM